MKEELFATIIELVGKTEHALKQNMRMRHERSKLYVFLVSGKQDDLDLVTSDFGLQDAAKKLRDLLHTESEVKQ